MTQKQINDIVMSKLNEVNHDMVRQAPVLHGRLRNCKASVYKNDNYYILKSYGTYVAFIDRRENICYDILRYTYGYTATSAGHIAKFKNDYGTYGHCETYRYYNNK